MVKTSENKKSKPSIGKLLEWGFISILGIIFIGYGFIAIFENKISAKGGFLRGMSWEAEGLPAIGIGCIGIYIGVVIIYYTFRK